jgi:hypothetical protein
MAGLELEAVVPSTPPPSSPPNTKLDKTLASPPPLSASMTPPPSSQPVRYHSPSRRFDEAEHRNALFSVSSSALSRGIGGLLPTTGAISGAGLEELRDIAKDLVNAVKEARTAAAHFKLQYNLLEMDTHEAAQRAEVEHQMTRKEVEVLQAAEQRHRSILATAARQSAPPPNAQIESLTQTCKDLENERDQIADRLGRAKRLIELEKDRADLLVEENALLKQRIRTNREHFSRFKSMSPNYNSSRDLFMTPARQAPPRFPDSTASHQPFAALLAADQVLSGESLSVPSTPRRTHATKVKHGHTRGAHSLSSLHTTPARTRPLTSDGFIDDKFPMSAPGSQLISESAERERHDRDSTISLSDAEDNGADDDIVPSQASSLATDMLRKNPATQESLRLSQNAERSSNLLQTKLFGNVKKPASSAPLKRRRSFEKDPVLAKKARLDQNIGLGIDAWNRPQA